MVPNIGTLLLVVVLLLTVPSLAAPRYAPEATSTSTISYQGRLADNAGNPLTGYYNLEFRIYDVPTGGVPLWEEFWTGANSVQVSDGLFNVMLGSINNTLAAAIEGHDELYLGITVGTDSEMVPRVQLGSVPFAMYAATANVPDGSITTEKIADEAVTQVKLTDRAVTATQMDLSGTRLAVGPIPDFTIGDPGWHDIPGLTLTAPEPGIYLIIAHLKIHSAAANNQRYTVALRVDGVEVAGTYTSFGGGANEESTVMIVHDATLNTGDTVQGIIQPVTSSTVLGVWTSMQMIRLSNIP